jgi:plasmid stabilization system protein ParE
MRIIYTRKAKDDLDGIRAFYQPRSPSGLRNIVRDITGVVNDMPESVSKGRQTPHPDVWEKVSPKYGYVLPYHIHRGNLYVLRVYDNSRGELDYDGIIDLET